MDIKKRKNEKRKEKEQQCKHGKEKATVLK